MVTLLLAHQRLHRLNIFVILSEKRRKRVAEYVPTDVLCNLARAAAGRMQFRSMAPRIGIID